jgi:hypothetical protein
MKASVNLTKVIKRTRMQNRLVYVAKDEGELSMKKKVLDHCEDPVFTRAPKEAVGDCCRAVAALSYSAEAYQGRRCTLKTH